MSLFGDVAFDKAVDDPNAIPDATYKCFLYDFKVGPTASGDKVGATFVYRIAEGQYEGRDIREWKQVPQKSADAYDENDVKQVSYLKQRLANLGVPDERMNTVTPDDLIGKRVWVTVKNRNGYVNAQRVTLDDGTTAESLGSVGEGKGVFSL